MPGDTCCCPAMCLLRRRDGVEQIGSALLAFGDGGGHRSIADRLGVPASTVRGWLRRFNAKAAFLAGQFVAVARRLDPSLGHIRGGFPGPQSVGSRWCGRCCGGPSVRSRQPLVLRLGCFRREAVEQHELPLSGEQLTGKPGPTPTKGPSPHGRQPPPRHCVVSLLADQRGC
ncbi:MAG: helix-turn-helix domain-containing protein [Candidatus Microthrix sp.]|nr:helix-turn-helix domain-containing protein [Candidatus Microthrix sp.]